MHREKQEGLIVEHLAGIVVFSVYLSLFTLDSAWRALS